MSNFYGSAINPKTGEVELAEFMDNYYGRHRYGIKFSDGSVYPETEVKRPRDETTK